MNLIKKDFKSNYQSPFSKMSDNSKKKNKNKSTESLDYMISDKNENIDENKKNNLMINQDFKNESISNKFCSKKEKRKIKSD